MATKPGFIVMGIEVPIEFRKRFTKPKDFWTELGKMFVAMAGSMTRLDLESVQQEFKNTYEFVEEILWNVNTVGKKSLDLKEQDMIGCDHYMIEKDHPDCTFMIMKWSVLGIRHWPIFLGR